MIILLPPLGCIKLLEVERTIPVNNKNVNLDFFNVDLDSDNNLYLVNLNLFYTFRDATGIMIVEEETDALLYDHDRSSLRGNSYINMNGSTHKVRFIIPSQYNYIGCSSSAFTDNSYEITATVKLYKLV